MSGASQTCFYGILAAVIWLCSPAAYAQTHGYGMAGFTAGEGALERAFRYGVGGGWSIAPRVLAGGEVGGIQDAGAGVTVSGNVSFHFRGRPSTGADPFVTGGATGVRFRGETALFANVGGGINYWLGPHVGIRAEFRQYPGGEDVSSFPEVRVGISFR